MVQCPWSARLAGHGANREAGCSASPYSEPQVPVDVFQVMADRQRVLEKVLGHPRSRSIVAGRTTGAIACSKLSVTSWKQAMSPIRWP